MQAWLISQIKKLNRPKVKQIENIVIEIVSERSKDAYNCSYRGRVRCF